ncbi:hypothetical protein LptCag_0057 [Leptospirillum ferriphilum]|uniref:Uncharacterized protein n=1 Tax=Leptospirillum ferriphilum TaxID=178606 RepID=A0A094X4E3_9BACT|nr:hypothetical protein LptCag_0057 [Leptospirillum ferriphilum]
MLEVFVKSILLNRFFWFYVIWITLLSARMDRVIDSLGR